MSCGIISNEDDTQAVFYCTSSDWAFGPVMDDLPAYHSAYETADAFREWLPLDPRSYDAATLEKKWCEFATNARRQAEYTRDDYEADQADAAYDDREA